MTDYFIKQGHTLISDDKIATFIEDGKFMVVGSLPYHRPYRKFEELGYHERNFMTDFKSISAFYVLEGIKKDAKIMIDEVRGFKKFSRLLPSHLFLFPFLKQKRSKYLSEMLNSIKVFHVKVPWDMEQLGKVYEAIFKHSKELK